MPTPIARLTRLRSAASYSLRCAALWFWMVDEKENGTSRLSPCRSLKLLVVRELLLLNALGDAHGFRLLFVGFLLAVNLAERFDFLRNRIAIRCVGRCRLAELFDDRRRIFSRGL